jgi:hypothetical protein
MRTLSTIKRIRIVRVETPDRSSHVRRHGWRPLAMAISVMALVSLSAAPALAASTGSSTATINVMTAVYSVTVSPAAFSFGNCSGGTSTSSSLGFPDGHCGYGSSAGSTFATGVTITNTGAAGHINVNGANAVPSDAGTPWTLCSEGGGTCTNLVGGLYYPGANQFSVETLSDDSSGNAYIVLSNSPACDQAFDAGPAGGCSAASGASQIEGQILSGPESSTDTSSTFTTTLTWTAGP